MFTLSLLVSRSCGQGRTYISAQEGVGTEGSSFAVVISVENNQNVFDCDLQRVGASVTA